MKVEGFIRNGTNPITVIVFSLAEIICTRRKKYTAKVSLPATGTV